MRHSREEIWHGQDDEQFHPALPVRLLLPQSWFQHPFWHAPILPHAFDPALLPGGLFLWRLLPHFLLPTVFVRPALQQDGPAALLPVFFLPLLWQSAAPPQQRLHWFAAPQVPKLPTQLPV